jgi:ketosteroid isomerase-like protein
MKTCAQVLCVIALMLAGCKGNFQSAGTSSEKETIRKLDAEWTQAQTDRNVEKILPYMASDVVQMAPNYPTIFGLDSLKKVLTAWAVLPNMDLSSQSLVDSVIITGDHAVDWGRFVSRTKMSGGVADVTGRWVNVWQKKGNDWKCIFIMVNDDKPVSRILEQVGTVEVFTAIENKWGNAMYKMDGPVLDSLFADEFTYLAPDGSVTGKKDEIAMLTSGKFKILSQPSISEIAVKIYGDVAVVKGIMEMKATYNGKNAGGRVRFVDTYVMRDYRWQCISTCGAQMAAK